MLHYVDYISAIQTNRMLPPNRDTFALNRYCYSSLCASHSIYCTKPEVLDKQSCLTRLNRHHNAVALFNFLNTFLFLNLGNLENE